MSLSNPVRSDAPNVGIFKTLQDSLARIVAPANLGIIAVLVISYFFTGKLGIQLSARGPGTTVVWLPAGISLAAILLRGNPVWPGVFMGAFLVNVAAGAHTSSSLGIALGSTLGALWAAYLVNKFAHGTKAFFKAGDVLRFIFLAGLLATAFCATFGTGVLCLTRMTKWTDFGLIWSIWWTGDLLGTLLLTPFLVLLFGHQHQALGARELAEFTLLLAGLSIICVLNFGPPVVAWIPRSGLHYLCAPFLAWAAVRFCPLEASGATLVLSAFAMWGSLHGFGLFATTTGSPYLGAGYVAVESATILTIAAVFAEQRKRLEEALGAYYTLKGKYERGFRAPNDPNQTNPIQMTEAGLLATGR